MKKVAEQIKELLDRLGDSADMVAAHLKAHGIQGVRHTVRMLNPIVRFIEKSLALRSLSIDLLRRDSICVALLDGTREEATVSQAVRQFLDAFDGGSYPELEAALNRLPATGQTGEADPGCADVGGL